MSHAMNILERLDKVRLKREGTISEQQYGEKHCRCERVDGEA